MHYHIAQSYRVMMNFVVVTMAVGSKDSVDTFNLLIMVGFTSGLFIATAPRHFCLFLTLNGSEYK